MQSNDFMKISLAHINDLNEIMEMYKSCVSGMEKHKITQWDKTYPNKDVIKNKEECTNIHKIANLRRFTQKLSSSILF